MSCSLFSEAIPDLRAGPLPSAVWSSDGPGISAVIMALADAFYEAALDQRTEL
ncbi:hypothetical protein ACWGPQ_07035 [Saccharomonospora azurea]